VNTHAINSTVPINGAPLSIVRTYYFDIWERFTATEYGTAWASLLGGIPTPVHLPHLPHRVLKVHAAEAMKISCEGRAMRAPGCDRVMYVEQEEH